MHEPSRSARRRVSRVADELVALAPVFPAYTVWVPVIVNRDGLGQHLTSETLRNKRESVRLLHRVLRDMQLNAVTAAKHLPVVRGEVRVKHSDDAAPRLVHQCRYDGQGQLHVEEL
jgi:hypothetical protein